MINSKNIWFQNYRKAGKRTTLCTACILSLLLCSSLSYGQSVNAIAKDVMSRFSSLSRSSGGPDTTSPRPYGEDSIHIFYYQISSPEKQFLDSAVNETNPEMLVNPYYVTLGNIGTATKPVYFDVNKLINFRTNIHAFAPYQWKSYKLPFFQQDRPFTKIGFSNGGTQEQHYFAQHSRNISPTFNTGLGFKLTSSQGDFKNQKTNILNFFFNFNFISKNERFRLKGSWASNEAEIQENGGVDFPTIQQAVEASNSNVFQRKSLLPVKIGLNAPSKENFFTNIINSGRILNVDEGYLAVSYDLGKTEEFIINKKVAVSEEIKTMVSTIDSSNYEEVKKKLDQKGFKISLFDTASITVEDSVTIEYPAYTFLPKFRIAYDYNFNYIKHVFRDEYYNDSKTSLLRTAYTDVDFSPFLQGINQDDTTLMIKDEIAYHKHTLDVSYFLKYARTDNYIKPYVSFLHYNLIDSTKALNLTYDLSVGAEVKLDLWNNNIRSLIKGEITVDGWHNGDNFIDANFKTIIPKLKASISFGLYNTFRSAPFHFTTNSNFFLGSNDVNTDWNKEYMLQLYGDLNIDFLKTQVQFNNYLFSNFFYFNDNFNPKQYNKEALNVSQLSIHNRFTLFKILHYSSDIWFQLSSNTDVITIPNFITRQRLYVGGRAFEKQDIATGIEMILVPDFYPQAYSPLISEWVYQNKDIKNTTTAINFFVHFRIRGFYFYIRAENINTINIEYDNGGFRYPEKNNSMFVANYFYPSFNLRFGFYWNLID